MLLRLKLLNPVRTGGSEERTPQKLSSGDSSNGTGPGSPQKCKDKAPEQGEDERRPTLESLLANHASLNVTNELEVHPPFTRGEFADVYSGSYRKRKVLLDVSLVSILLKIFRSSLKS